MGSEFKNLISAKNITFLTATEKTATIKELVDKAISVNKLAFDNDKLLEEFMKREKRGSTGLQNGIAVPHIKTNMIDYFCLTIGIHRTGIDFKSLDGKPTQVIFLLIAPLSQANVHLQFLSMISRLFLKKDFYQQVLEFNDTESLCEFFKNTFTS